MVGVDEEIIMQLLRSWQAEESPVAPTGQILGWIAQRNRDTQVRVDKIGIGAMEGWFYDANEGVLRNRAGTFFKIAGLRAHEDGRVVAQQPIILQPEIGYLGIICKQVEGVLHFLMQAKIEPGSVNQVQISPTIQATKSNFTQAHGGAQPAYLEYFAHAGRHRVLYDQLQSEQSSRFLAKRNRNMVVLVQDEVEVLPGHRWMTLGQIKKLMCQHDNLVNMDTRTVLSGLPFSVVPCPGALEQQGASPLMRSVFGGSGQCALPQVYGFVNDRKMFAQRRHELVPLHQLDGWTMGEQGVFPDDGAGFQVVYCSIDIEGREVRHWCQPLVEALGTSVFGLVSCDIDGVRHFLVQAVAEPGCPDGLELGPSIQRDATNPQGHDAFMELAHAPESQVLCDVMLSEEGGRFYHEQNRNLLIHTTRQRIGSLPPGFFLLDYTTLNRLCQVNNCLNIQLRNLLSLLRLA